MKKVILFVLLYAIVFSLTGCNPRPFVGTPGTEYVVSDNVSLTYFNGSSFNKIFEYEFTKEYMFFEPPVSGGFDFTAINYYQDISNEFIAFLALYDDFKMESRYLNKSTKTITLSLGATESNYNTVKVPVDGDVYDVDAYLVLEDGVNAIFVYTEFYSDGEQIIVPDYLYIYTTDIHEAYLKEFLPINNEYSTSKVVLTSYITHIFPTPPRVSTESDFEVDFDVVKDFPNLGYFEKLSYDTTDSLPGFVEVCDADFINCFTPEFSSLKIYVYKLEQAEVITFYQTLFDGHYIGDDFVITNLGMEYILVFGTVPSTCDTYCDDDMIGDILTIDVSVYTN